MLAGCAGPAFDPVRTGPFFSPMNVAGEPSLNGLRRVVLLPICGAGVASQEIVGSFDPIFAAALQRQNRFEVVTLSRQDCRRKFHVPELPSTAALPTELSALLRREFAADAVLFVDVTVFHAYGPLRLGLRAKLATLDGKRLIWNFDNVFASDEPAVANAARRSVRESAPADLPADLSPAVLQSPGRFAHYAAGAMFATLPPVTSPIYASPH
jgi:hypothetical protein